MEIIKYLFEGFFIAILGSYLIGNAFKPDDIVIMASAIAIMLMLSDSFGQFYKYLKKKLTYGARRIDRSLSQLGGADGTMGLQSALYLQKVLKKQTGGADGTMGLQTALYQQKLISGVEKMNSKTDVKSKEMLIAQGEQPDDEDAIGDFANYETVYNIPEMSKMPSFMTSNKVLPQLNVLKRDYSARKQLGGEAGKKHVFNRDLITMTDSSGRHLTLNDQSGVILTDDAANNRLYKLRFERVDDEDTKLSALNYLQPVYLVFNDKDTMDKKMINHEGGNLNSKASKMVKYILIDKARPENTGPINSGNPLLIKTVANNKFITVKVSNLSEGADADATSFTLGTTAECGPLWLYGTDYRNNYEKTIGK